MGRDGRVHAETAPCARDDEDAARGEGDACREGHRESEGAGFRSKRLYRQVSSVAVIELDGVAKTFDGTIHALQDVSFSVPTGSVSLPDWLHPFVRYQPVSQVTQTLRGFAAGHVVVSNLAASVAWCLGLLVVFGAIAVRVQRRAP